MKRITTIFAAILMIPSAFLPQQASAQAPQKMSYQAIVRNSSDALITSTSVGMRMSILQGAANGTAVYVETQTPTTNINGLVSLEIGAGIIVNGDFSTIDWANGPYFIRTETDPNGGANYTITGTSELLSVPYALFSANGTPGPQGAQGPVGANGTNGTNGSDGNGIVSTVDNGDGTFTFTYDDGSTFTTSDLTGPQGATGAQGPQGLQGIQGPQGPAGANGTNGTNGLDGNGIASTTDNGDGTFTFTYDDGSTFTTSDLTGPQGAAGVQGAQGATGPQGPAGPQGSQGFSGPTGSQGAQGATGPAGQGGVTSAGSGINVTGAGTIASPYVVSTTSPCGLAIGQTYQGGIIFYLDASGCHGLISAPTDQSTGIQWWNGSDIDTYASGSGLFDGDGNCYRIRRSQGDCASCNASEICLDLSLGGYTDWYLPSKYELNLMYRNIGQGNALGLGNVGGFASIGYWSSTEYGNASAWRLYFNDGSQPSGLKGGNFYVRAVRAF